MSNRPLKLYNGRIDGRQQHGYIAAHSRAEASRLLGRSQGEIKRYWYEGQWDSESIRVIGPPTEPCFWVYDRDTGVYTRKDKPGTIEPPPQIDPLLLRRAQARLENYWRPGDTSPNYIDIIAADCGWNPLGVGERMNVGMGGKKYTITREA